MPKKRKAEASKRPSETKVVIVVNCERTLEEFGRVSRSWTMVIPERELPQSTREKLERKGHARVTIDIDFATCFGGKVDKDHAKREADKLEESKRVIYHLVELESRPKVSLSHCGEYYTSENEDDDDDEAPFADLMPCPISGVLHVLLNENV